MFFFPLNFSMSAAAVHMASISHDCPESFNNYDANRVPNDTSVIRPPHVFTPADMEVLITHPTGKSLS